MDNSILYTRCPTCSTAFKVTDELLTIAGGKVRCGACLAIFQASDYMLEPVKKAEVIETPASPVPVKTETSISEFLQQTSPEPEIETKLLPDEKLENAEIENRELFGEGFYDENDLDTRNIESNKLKGEALGTDDLEDENQQHFVSDEKQLSFEDEFDFEDEIDNESEEADPELYESEDLDEPFDLEVSDQNHFNEENGLAFDEIDSDDFETGDLGNESELAEQINTQIQDVESEPDPLDEFSDIIENNPSGFRTKIIITSLLLLLIVALTQVWTNRQAIAWNDTWGSMMKTACNALPCKLKPKRAINQIKLLQRQVSPHQEKEKTLDIKVLLVNQAKFSQPYPIIKIAFSDKNGKEVAVKHFKPINYLRNGSKNDLMPPNAEVHIQFDTKTPHPDALGFEFIFE